MAQDYWYDGQLRRYWLQFTRIFEGIQYESGVGATGDRMLRSFPVKLASKNRQVGHILRNNSENTIMATPQITCEMTSIQPSGERRQQPNFVSSVNVVERAFDQDTGLYTSERGNAYTIDRMMPIPYDITMRVDVWTSNESQKHQFMEQIMMLFNPSIDLQTNTNAIDWSSLTTVELTELTWSNREMPIGTEDEIEVSSLLFKMPIWINPPAKIKRQNIIHQIITNITSMSENEAATEGSVTRYKTSDVDLHTRVIVTPGDHKVQVNRISGSFEVVLLTKHGEVTDEQGEPLCWAKYLSKFGKLRAGVSQLRLKTSDDLDDDATDVVGVFDIHPGETNKLIWTPDLSTYRPNTIAAINGVISLQDELGHPRYPGNGMPEAVSGQRYILAEDLSPGEGWGDVRASINDVVEFNGVQWSVAFDASVALGVEYVLNQRSAQQLKWTGEQWLLAVDGQYGVGLWRVFL